MQLMFSFTNQPKGTVHVIMPGKAENIIFDVKYKIHSHGNRGLEKGAVGFTNARTTSVVCYLIFRKDGKG